MDLLPEEGVRLFREARLPGRRLDLAREAPDREPEAPEWTLQLSSDGEDVGQGRFLERRQALEEVRRDPAVAPPRGARLRGREEAVAYRLADEVPGQVVEERVGRSVRCRVRGLIEDLAEQVGEVEAAQEVASPA